MKSLARWCSWLAAWASCACVQQISDGRRAAQVIADCVVPPPAAVARLPAPVALEYPTGSLWLWGELERAEGGVWSTPTMWVPDVDSACAGTTSLVTDTAQQPLELLPLSAQEVADNQSRSDGRRLALRPLGGFVADNIGYLYYQELLLGPGLFDEELLATSLCRLGDRQTPCDRAQHERIWEQPRFNWGHAAWLAADDTVYLYGCQRPAAFADSCSVARAPLAQVGQVAAVDYYNFAQGWIADSGNTTVLFEGPSAVTVTFNAHASGFIAVSPNIWDSRFEVRVADQPWGDFRGARLLFDALPPNNNWFIGGGRAHTALGSADGSRIVVSYDTDNESAPGVHLVSLALKEGVR